MDFKAINSAVMDHLEDLVREIDPGAQPSGREWLFRNPRRQDTRRGSASLNRDTGIWKDWAAGEDAGGGDAVSWWAYCRNTSQFEAGKELAQRFGVNGSGRPEKPWKGPKDALEFVPIFKAPELPYEPPRGASTIWTYRDEDGQPLFQRHRVEPKTPEGKKSVLWWCVFRDAKGNLAWKCQAPPIPRPLYGLPDLKNESRDRILIVEGEKTADAARLMLPRFKVLTSGGADTAGSADWSPLQPHHTVIIWYDNDEAGRKYAGEVAAKHKAMGISVRVVEVPKTWPEKWDLADPLPPGVSPAEVQRMIDEAPYWDGHQDEPVPSCDQLEVLTWDNFKGKPIPPLRWIWEPYLPHISFGIFASMPKHGKSIMSLQIGVAVATGLPLFGLPTCGPGGVGILALEDDQDAIHRRMVAIVESYGKDWTPEHDRLLAGNLKIMRRSRLALEELSADKQEFRLAALAMELGTKMKTTLHAPVLLFIDTLNAVHDGDENDATEARPFNAAIYALNASLGCSIWPLHHLRKAGVGKNAPPLEDRLSTELIRGSSALLAGARGTVQFGWVVPSEASKVNLDPVNCMRHYSILSLTSVNDGPSSPWMLLEHSSQAGIWVPVHSGDKALAALRGGSAAQELTRSEEILLDVSNGLKHKELAEKYYPDDPKADAKVKAQLGALRSRHRWLQRSSLELTVQGFTKVKELGVHDENDVYLEGGEDDHLRPSA